jgi:hypothetical protein
MSWRCVLVVLTVAGCRFDIDSHVAVPPDAAAPTPLHRYRLAGDFTDDFGGLPLSPLGGALDSTGYKFAMNQGLQLSTGMPVSVYTIDLKLAFDQLASWRKIVDFKGLSIDHGLYVFDSELVFVETINPDTTFNSPALLVAGVPFEMTLTRDAAGVVVGYVNRVPQITLTDNFGIGTFTESGARAVFGVDDTATEQREASSGMIREIRIWDVALTADQISTL